MRENNVKKKGVYNMVNNTKKFFIQHNNPLSLHSDWVGDKEAETADKISAWNRVAVARLIALRDPNIIKVESGQYLPRLEITVASAPKVIDDVETDEVAMGIIEKAQQVFRGQNIRVFDEEQADKDRAARLLRVPCDIQ